MADAARAQRQKALEEKKKRLEELKARRTQRASNFVSAQDAAKAKIAASSNLDKYIDGLLKVPNANNPVASGAATNSGTAGASYSYSYSAHNPTGENGTAGAGFESGSKKSESASSSEHQAAGGVSYSTQHPIQQAAATVAKMETFEMGTQTATDDFPSTGGSNSNNDNDNDSEASKTLLYILIMPDAGTKANGSQALPSSDQAFFLRAHHEEGVELILLDVTVIIGISLFEGSFEGILVPLLIGEL